MGGFIVAFFRIIFLLFFAVLVYSETLIINKKSDFSDVLQNSKIFIDESKKMTLDDILKKDVSFVQNNKKHLGFGYSPNFNVWVKFSLKNESNKSVEKILEYDNTLTTDIKFFDANNTQTFTHEGLFHMNENRKTINPIFKIKLKANESKTFYLQTSSYITTLIIKLNLWDTEKFYAQHAKHQFYLALFFGAMFILAIYNLFIFFFTKDISYLFYVFYVFGVIFHQLVYVGIGNIYLFNHSAIINIINFASLLVAFPIFALALFTKTFLQTQIYPRLNRVLNLFLITMPMSILFFSVTDLFNQYRSIFPMCLLLFLMILTIYATYKKNRQAYFILFGWLIIVCSGMIMYLSSTGLINIYKNFPYIVEIGIVLEAIIFSIALADRINQLQKDKQEANKQLITQQENEKQRLETQVENKTSDLKIALDEKGLLLKELNHRVKNNMQMIVSLINLQTDSIEDEKTQEVFNTAQNRIKAMSHLHELLYKQDNVSNINAYDYFSILIEELKYSYDKDININYSIQTQLPMEQAVYCGIIVNELVSNSFKYAFKQNGGTVTISLKKENHLHQLCVSDDGIGYKKKAGNSLGLILVETLALKQLRATIETCSLKGVKVLITWDASQKLELF